MRKREAAALRALEEADAAARGDTEQMLPSAAVLCSDGVSDAISNDEIVRAAGVALEGGQDPAAAVCDAAVQAWAEKFGRRRRDDITAVVVRL